VFPGAARRAAVMRLVAQTEADKKTTEQSRPGGRDHQEKRCPLASIIWGATERSLVMTRYRLQGGVCLVVAAGLAGGLILATGCDSMSKTERNTLVGTGIGAGIGAIAGGGKGTAIGAGAGALGGLIIGAVEDEKDAKREREQREYEERRRERAEDRQQYDRLKNQDQKEWEEFQEYQRWKSQQEAG
jgi:hypothetical protein